MRMGEIEELRSEVRRLKTLVGERDGQLSEKNVELDTLHYVWCDGGCQGGVHRYIKTPLTPDVVARAIRNTDRLVSWYVSRAGRNYYGFGGFSKARGHSWRKLKKVWRKARADIESELRKPEKE
jgi:hypothetical protein